MPPLIIIPAREGSTRIHLKNFTPLAGRSPVLRAVDVAMTIPDAQVVVTTDAPERIQDPRVIVHRRRVPGDGPMYDVVTNVLLTYPGDEDQPVLLVQPTQPLREPKHLESAVAWLRTGRMSVASITRSTSADKLYQADGERLWPIGAHVERDQEGTVTYRCDGTVYGFHRQWFLNAPPERAFHHPVDTWSLVIPEEETCALDTPHDWYVASLILADRRRGAAS